MELRMKKDNGYVLTETERKELKEEIIDLLVEYDYSPTESAIDKVLDEWVRNKGWMINLFKKHPNYNGKYQITFDADYDRVCNKSIVYNFSYYFLDVARKLLMQEMKINNVYTYREVYNIYHKLQKVKDYMEEIRYQGYHPIVNGRSFEETVKEFNAWDKKLSIIHKNPNYIINDYTLYDKKQYELYNAARRFRDCVLDTYLDSVATEEIAKTINGLFPNVKAVAGQKISRIVNKVCNAIGVDKDSNYNREFAKYSDTINPLAIKRHTILSCHPVDYLTMSFGNSWSSCHTIDKSNKRGMPDNYHGCYSGGTLSYMLDDSSFVFYTVNKDYNGDMYELEDKINRNMFHMGEDKLIQARVYPQSTDGANGIYKQIREIAQKVIADCLEVPNMWKNVKGSEICRDSITSRGVHYRDYASFKDCNVSYLKRDEDNEVNRNKIIVGHDPICTRCGGTHRYEEAIECSYCYEGNGVRCAHCGRTYDEDDMYYIDGDWYCDYCTYYCEYHECYEPESCDHTYIEGYGYVCIAALDCGDFSYCERCGEYYCHHDGITTEDGNWYCSEYCAEHDGYEKTSDGEWYPEDEVYYCEHCKKKVHKDDWNSELDCCDDCYDEVAAERESEEE